jgi:replicative DNA helicase
MNSPEYERAVLTVAFVSTPNNVTSLARLKASDFTEPFHRTLFGICREFHAQGRMVDLTTARSKLVEAGVISDEGLNRILDARVDGRQLETYVEAILQASRERRVLSATELYAVAYKSTPHLYRQHLADLRNELAAAMDGRVVENSESVIERSLKAINDAADHAWATGTAGIPTGYRALDYYSGGWREGLIFVISWSSGGKTAFELVSILGCGNAGYRFRLYSLDMAASDILLRLAAQRHMIPGEIVSSGKLSEGQREHVTETASWLMQHGSICEESLSIDELVDDAIAYRDTYDVVFVDTLQSLRIDIDAKRQSPYDRMCYALNRLKELKKRIKKPIVIAAQAKDPPDRRECAKGNVAPPTLNDAEGARRITQEAHQMVIVWRHNYPEHGPAGATIQLAKCQKGLTGPVQCRWNAYIGRFEEEGSYDTEVVAGTTPAPRDWNNQE